MKFRVLGSFGGDSPECRMTSFLVDDQVALDAGATTRALTLDEQKKIRHILISHTHMDHTATLPFLVENTFDPNTDPITVYATPKVLANVKRHLFNNDTWPDFTCIPDQNFPSVKFEEVEAEKPFVIRDLPGGDLEITAIPVNHIVPTMGFLLRQGGRSVIFTSDTGPTERIWEVASETDDLRALITECSFPNRMQHIADVSLHLSPQTLAIEVAKIRRDVPVYIYHLKPPFLEELRAELASTPMVHDVREVVQDKTYEF